MMLIPSGPILLPGIFILLLVALIWSIWWMKRRQAMASHRASIDELSRQRQAAAARIASIMAMDDQ